MKIEIEISEEDAACIWADNWGEKTGESLEEIVRQVLVCEANGFRLNFPESVKKAAEQFREANVNWALKEVAP